MEIWSSAAQACNFALLSLTGRSDVQRLCRYPELIPFCKLESKLCRVHTWAQYPQTSRSLLEKRDQGKARWVANYVARDSPALGLEQSPKWLMFCHARLFWDAHYQGNCLELSQDPGCFIAHIDAKHFETYSSSAWGRINGNTRLVTMKRPGCRLDGWLVDWSQEHWRQLE